MLKHLILTNRTKYLGIEGSPLKWLTSFITNRTSSIKINVFISPPTTILNFSKIFQKNYILVNTSKTDL